MPLWIHVVIVAVELMVGAGVIFGVAYLRRKAKNLATKQDIREVREEISEVEHRFEQKSKHLKKKRDLYSTVITSMRTFLSGTAVENKEQEFESAYDELWLWGSDQVVSSVTDFLKTNIAYNQRDDITQEALKGTYAICVEQMRKDVGVSETKLDANDYLFVGFGDTER